MKKSFHNSHRLRKSQESSAAAAKLRHALALKSAIALSLFLSLTQVSRSQVWGGGRTNVQGPFIQDQFPMNNMGARGLGGGGRLLGPRIGIRYPLRRPAQNAVQDLTSSYGTFNNGLIMTRYGVDSGLGSVNLFPRAGFRGAVRGFNGSIADGLKIGFGPVMMSDFEAGAGMFYTDYDSPTGRLDDSGWASVLTLSSTVTVTTPLISITARAQGYYLPFEDEWGFGTPPVLANLGVLGLWDPGVFMLAAMKGTVGGWDLLVYDIFIGDYISNNMTDVFFDEPFNPSAGVNLPSQAGLDQVGRYGFGGAYLDRQGGANSRIQFPRFASNGSYLNSDRMLFTNSTGIVVGKMLSPNTRSINWFRRDDFWATNQFTSLGNFISGGTYMESAFSPSVQAFAGYEFGTFDEFHSVQHLFRTGAFGYLSDSVGYSLNAGYFWTSGTSNNRGIGLYDAFLMHYVGSRFMQYAGGGRGVTDPTFGERFVNDYIQYGASYMIGPRTLLQGVAGYYQTDGSLTQTASLDASFAGIRLRVMAGERSFLSLSSITERYDFHGTGQETNQWIHRLIYGVQLAKQTTGYAGYQYIDRHSNVPASSFSEHLLLFYLVYRF